MLAYGNGRSYGDSCLNDGGTLIDMRGLDDVLVFDRETGLITCGAGLLLDQLLNIVVPAGSIQVLVANNDEIAVSIVNQISVGIENVGAAKLKNTLFNAENSAMKMFNAPGSPGGLADPVAAGGPMAALGAALGLITGLRLGAAGISAAVLQVQDAVKAQEAIEAERHARQEKAVAELRRLQDLARQAKTPKMDALADKLQALETAVHDKDVEDMGNSPMSTRSFVDTGKAILEGVERTSGH